MRDRMTQPLVRVNKNVDRITKNMKKSQRQVQKWQNNFTRGMDKVIKKTLKVGLAVGAMVGAFAAKIGFEGLKNLDEVSAKVKSIAKDALKIKNIRKDLLKASTQSGIDVTELGETQYSAISSGVSPKDSLKASVKASKLAKAGFTDANSALKTNMKIMNVYRLKGIKAMQDVSDKLMVIQNKGVTTIAEISETIGPLTPIARSAGLSIDELGSGIAALTKNGMETTDAMTAYKGLLSSIIKPSKEAQDEAKRLGIDFSVSAIKSKGFSKFLQEIKDKTKGSTDSMGKLFGNVRALSGALLLAGDGIEDFNSIMDDMRNSAGATEEAYKTMTNTIGFKLNKMKNTAKNVFTKIMDTQSGTIGKMIDNFDTWVQNNEKTIDEWVNKIGDAITKAVKFAIATAKWVKENKDMIATIGTFLVSLWGVIKVFGIVKKVLGAIQTIWFLLNGTIALTPIGWAVVGITALITAGVLLWKNWDKVNAKWNEFGKKYPMIYKVVNTIAKIIKEVFIFALKDLWVNIQAIWIIVKEVFNGALNIIENTLGNIIEFIENVFTGNWEKAFENILDIFTGIFSGIWDTAKSIWDKINGLFEDNKEVYFNVDTKTNIPKHTEDAVVKIKSKTPKLPKNPITDITNLDKFAKGGIATKPSIFGDAGAEIAIPLKKNNPRSISLLEQAKQFFRDTDADNNITINNHSKQKQTSFGGTTKQENNQPINLKFYGDIYGLDDFREKVMEAIVIANKVNKPNMAKGV